MADLVSTLRVNRPSLAETTVGLKTIIRLISPCDAAAVTTLGAAWPSCAADKTQPEGNVGTNKNSA